MSDSQVPAMLSLFNLVIPPHVQGHKEMVLRRVNEHFDSLHHRSAPAEARAASMLSQEPVATTAAHVDPAHLRSAEGTVLLHYTLAIRQQQVSRKGRVKATTLFLGPRTRGPNRYELCPIQTFYNFLIFVSPGSWKRIHEVPESGAH